MSDLISRQAAIDAMLGDKVEITNVIRAIGNERDFEVLNCTCDRHAEIIKALPTVQPTITHEQAIDYLHETGWLQSHDRILTEREQMKGQEIIRCHECKHNPLKEWFGCPMAHLNSRQRPEDAWCWRGEREDGNVKF